MPKHKKLHILLVQQSPALGGAEMYMRDLVRQWTNDGHQISGLVYGEKFQSLIKPFVREMNTMSVQFDIIGNYRGLIKSLVLFPFLLWRYYRSVKATRAMYPIDVILVSGLNDKMIATALGKLCKIPVVWIEYGPLSGVLNKHMRIPRMLYRLLVPYVSTVVTPSSHTIESLVNDGGVARDKVKVVPCGVAIPHSFKHLRSSDIYMVGCVSRLTPEKGQEYLLRAVALVRKQVPNIQCLIVGDGPDAKRLQECAKGLKVDDVCEFTGFADNLDEYFARMDVCVFPSTWELEGFGLVPIEAMARKIPVIAFDNGPVKETVGDVGVLVPTGDVEGLSDALMRLSSQKKLRDSYAKLGYTKACKQYDIIQQARVMIETLGAATNSL